MVWEWVEHCFAEPASAVEPVAVATAEFVAAVAVEPPAAVVIAVVVSEQPTCAIVVAVEQLGGIVATSVIRGRSKGSLAS